MKVISPKFDGKHVSYCTASTGMVAPAMGSRPRRSEQEMSLRVLGGWENEEKEEKDWVIEASHVSNDEFCIDDCLSGLFLIGRK